MSGNLIIPRVEVKWGETNLTSYSGSGDFPANEPLVFKAEIHLESQSNGPTASMLWNPSGKAFKIYEDCVANKIDQPIVVRFYYAEGKSMTTVWVWSGQSISFGNDMSVKVNLISRLAGLVNSNIRNVAQVHDKPATFMDTAQKLPNMYAVKSDVVKYSSCARKDLQAAKLNNHYAKDSTFGSAFTNLMEQNGNTVFPSNIQGENMVVMCPFSWDSKEAVYDASEIPAGESPQPEKRYGYILGPSVINSLSRSVDWKPPQQTKTNTPQTQTKPQGKNSKKTTPQTKTTGQPAPQKVTEEQKQKPTSAPSGTSGGAANPNVSNAENKDGPKKQEILQNENTAKLQFQTFMVPVLTGIKPNDIVYVPSLNGTYVEDWIVQSVGYNQTDGGVEISVEASRIYGVATLMNNTAGNKFRAKIESLKTLEDWDAYAWRGSEARFSDTGPQSARGYGEVVDY